MTSTAFDAQIKIAVLDTGADLDHPDLVDRILWSWNEITDVPNGDDDSRTGHGTHTAGTIAATKNGAGVMGVAPNVGLYIIKVLDKRGSGSYTDIADGIIRAAKGPDGVINTADDADVISMSLGGPVSTDELYAAIQFAYNAGVVIVASAGNDGDGDENTFEYNYPALYDEVISVGATTYLDTIASFSSSAPSTEVSDPGYYVYSTLPGGTYGLMSGTSMSCPHVAGVVGLVLAMSLQKYGTTLPAGTFDDMGSNTVRGILHSTAFDLGTTGYDYAFGYGLILATAAVAAV
ncbi:MAG: S8 family peptidase [Candidatus Heimdallarchaeota archaeon]|nr:S8 family peptidase [Candidatus Heimdallarchaeota archaeon]MCK5049393.1 S8 family peptidase [Candidatus Heimdallarchaeota archaeon]